MGNKYKILIIEDELNICNFVKTILETNNYQVFTANTCNEGIIFFNSFMPDLVILDLGLPDMDGLEFIKYARKTSSTPIIVLSARTTENDKVTALDFGANDYITKPFGTAELLARVRASIRNSRKNSEKGTLSGGNFVIGDLEINYNKRELFVKGQKIDLTQTEYNIIMLLSERTGEILTYETIIRKIWGNYDMGSIKKLQVNMANIRKKLHEKPGDNRYIINELGVGYRLNDEQ